MRSTTYTTLDLQKPNFVTVYAVQDDQLTRWVHADLTDGGAAWAPPSGTLMTIRYKKPDGTGGWYDSLEDGGSAYAISGSAVDFGFAAQCLTVPGIVLVEVSFWTTSAERLSSFLFRLQVEKNPLTDAEIESSDYYNVLSDKIAAVLGATTHPPQIDPTTKNWLLWDKNVGGYADSGFSSVGQTGPAPQITSQTRYWQRSSSGTEIPTGEWSSSPLSGVPGQFLWTKSEIVYNNGDKETLYLAAYQGNDGLGAPGSQLPLMDGEASAGSANAYSREDHVHPLARYRTFLTVGSRDADFTTVNAAITYCKTKNVTNACILIQSGDYYENIELLGANNICLFGIGRVRIINTDAVYPQAALYATGFAQFYNIEFISQDNATDAYGLHIEALVESSPSELRFYNCTFLSTKNAGAGIGTGSYYDLVFQNCRFYSNPNSGLFIHNYAATGFQGYAAAAFLNCRFTSTDTYQDIVIHDAHKMAGLSGSSPLLLTFANCTAIHGKIGYSEQSGVYLGYLPATSQIVLDAESQSDILGVNYIRRAPTIGGIIATTPGGIFTYPLPDADKYDITIISALNENNADILSGCGIIEKTNSFFVGHCPAGSGVCNMNFTATPSL